MAWFRFPSQWLVGFQKVERTIRFEPGRFTFRTAKVNAAGCAGLTRWNLEIGQLSVAKYVLGHSAARVSQDVLSPDEVAHAQTLAAAARQRFLTGRVLLRCALSDFVSHAIRPGSWQFVRESGGKLAVVALVADLGISLAHTRSGAVVVIAPHPVGLDVEEIDRELMDGDLDPYLAEGERQVLGRVRPLDRSRHLLSLWTLKEAFLKLRGTGLAADPAAVEFALGSDPQPRIQPTRLSSQSGHRSVVWGGEVVGREVVFALAV